MNIIIEQFLIFNNDTNNKLIINYITTNNIMVYNIINDINVFYSDIYDNINLKDITWIYEENNIRIPYFNDIKIIFLKINKINIYDYISSNSLINNKEIICGEKIQSLCDIVLHKDNSYQNNPNYNKFSKNIQHIDYFYDFDKYKSIYIKTDDLLYFYINKKDQIKNNIIVSHNSDFEIDEKYIQYIDNIKIQLSQNTVINNDKIISIPIGIENTMWFDHDILHEIRKIKDIKKTKNVYFYFSFNTHSSRQRCYDILKDKLEWNIGRNKKEYFIELKKHKYAICPRGNGVDCHRLWECLYLDVIPIVIKNDFININNLPIIVLNDWIDFNENNLTYKYLNINNNKVCLNYYNNIINNNIEIMKIIILIIAHDESYYNKYQNIWKRYMNIHPYIDCYFIKCSENIENDIVIDNENKTIYCKGIDSLNPGIINKTIKSINYILRNEIFDYIIRTNLSSIWDLDKLYNFLKDKRFHYGGVIGYCESFTFISGAGIFLSKDACYNLIKNNDILNKDYLDDVSIGYLFKDIYEKYEIQRKNIESVNDFSDNLDNYFHFRCHSTDKDLSLLYMEKVYNKIYNNK